MIHSSTGLLSEMVFMVGLTMAFMVMVSFIIALFSITIFTRTVFTIRDAFTLLDTTPETDILTIDVTPLDAR